MARNRAPYLSSVLCCGALESWPRSQYSPRPPEFGLKKSPNLIPDRKANLSRPRSVPRHPENTLNRLFFSSRAGVFLLFESLGSALANSNEADRSDDFCSNEKRRHTRAPILKKINVEHLLWEQPNETYVHQPDARGIDVGRRPGHGRGPAAVAEPVSYTHLTLPTNREV